MPTFVQQSSFQRQCHPHLCRAGDLAWNEVVSPELNNPIKLWPKDNQNVVFTQTINHRYENSEAQEKPSAMVTDAIALWMYK
jgi:hypothetical protein